MNMIEWILIGVLVLLAFLCISAFRSSDVRKRRR
jgi:hypothetical protein